MITKLVDYTDFKRGLHRFEKGMSPILHDGLICTTNIEPPHPPLSPVFGGEGFVVSSAERTG